MLPFGGWLLGEDGLRTQTMAENGFEKGAVAT